MVLPVEIKKLAALRIEDAITALENVASDLVDVDVDVDVDVLNDMRSGVNEAHIITSSLHDLLSRAAAYQRAIEAQLGSKLAQRLLDRQSRHQNRQQRHSATAQGADDSARRTQAPCMLTKLAGRLSLLRHALADYPASKDDLVLTIEDVAALTSLNTGQYAVEELGLYGYHSMRREPLHPATLPLTIKLSGFSSPLECASCATNYLTFSPHNIFGSFDGCKFIIHPISTTPKGGTVQNDEGN